MAARASKRDLVRMRLAAHMLVGEPACSVEHVARRMLAIQAQDLGQAGWAIGVRGSKLTTTAVATAFRSGTIVRSWPMRGTLHIVPVDELAWMLELTTPRMLQKTAARRAQLGLDEVTLGRARDAAEHALEGGGSLDRSSFLRMLEATGIDTKGQRGYHLIYHLAQTGVLVWGPCTGDVPRASTQALVLAGHWLPRTLAIEREDALTRFLTGYLSGHGPATLHDFAWWSGLTMADAKAARNHAGDAVRDVSSGGVSYLVPAGLADSVPSRASVSVHALAGFDEYVLGYQDRSLVLDAAHAPHITPGNNGIFQPAIISRGHVVGTWRRGARATTTRIEPQPFGEMSAADRRAFDTSAKRYLRYLRGGG